MREEENKRMYEAWNIKVGKTHISKSKSLRDCPHLSALNLSSPMDSYDIQFIENYFISPRVTKVTMDIHPAVAVFATIFGAYTAGVIGAVLALPIAATIQGIIEIILLNRDNSE